MADYLNIHLAKVLIGLGAMVWIYASSSSSSSSSNGNSEGGGDGSATTVSDEVARKYKHL
jgi:hypothetical protein